MAEIPVHGSSWKITGSKQPHSEILPQKSTEMKNSVVTPWLGGNLPGRTHKASAGVAGVVLAVLVYSPHTADLDPEDN